CRIAEPEYGLKVFENPLVRNFLADFHLYLADRDSLLKGSVSVTDGNRIVLQRLMIDRYAKGSSYKVLPCIPLSDGIFFLIDHLHIQFKVIEYSSCFFREAVFFYDGKHRCFH